VVHAEDHLPHIHPTPILFQLDAPLPHLNRHEA
jgi:hypothetical protein